MVLGWRHLSPGHRRVVLRPPACPDLDVRGQARTQGLRRPVPEGRRDLGVHDEPDRRLHSGRGVHVREEGRRAGLWVRAGGSPLRQDSDPLELRGRQPRPARWREAHRGTAPGPHAASDAESGVGRLGGWSVAVVPPTPGALPGKLRTPVATARPSRLRTVGDAGTPRVPESRRVLVVAGQCPTTRRPTYKPSDTTKDLDLSLYGRITFTVVPPQQARPVVFAATDGSIPSFSPSCAVSTATCRSRSRRRWWHGWDRATS